MDTNPVYIVLVNKFSKVLQTESVYNFIRRIWVFLAPKVYKQEIFQIQFL